MNIANKFDSDVRPLSNDQRYMGVVFSGSIKRALKQAHQAPEHPLPEQPGRPAHISRSRWNLLEHLNLAKHYTIPAPSKYSLAHAMTRWPENFKA